MAEMPRPEDGRARHDEHDPELIVALLDRDVPEIDRASATARINACSDCATLHADLLALARMTAELPVPARPRDFALTPSIAATLAPRVAGELVPAAGRLTGEMPDTHTRNALHASHDRLLIANLADRTVSEPERVRAETQMAACVECRQLLDDLVAISVATRSLPVARRPREFTLSPADANRLRTGGWRRILAAFGTSRDALSRPLAFGLTTLGLAGLLVATIPSVFTGQATSAPAFSALGSAPGDATGGAAPNPGAFTNLSSAAPSAAPAVGPAAAQPAAPSTAPEIAAPVPAASAGSDEPPDSRESDRLFLGAGESSQLPGEPEGQSPFDLYGKSLALQASGPSTLLLALILLVVGLGLFTLRWMARRLGDG